MLGSKSKGLVAVIPARSGSKRVKDKNIKFLNGHPLIAYSISSAIEANIFERVLVATDSQRYADIAVSCGAEVPSLRSVSISGDHSPDIDWVKWCIEEWSLATMDIFCLLRPTSPLRTASEIKRGISLLQNNSKADSVRAVSKCSIHPGKMWVKQSEFMYPLFPFLNEKTPWHSSQTASLHEVFFQNASFEAAKVESILKTSSIAGDTILPMVSENMSGFDVNEELDFEFLEYLVDKGKVNLPTI